MTDAERKKLIRVLCADGKFKEAKALLTEQANMQQNFVSFMDRYIAEHGLKRNSIVMYSGIELKYGYKLLNGSRHTTNRDLIIRLCIVMDMQEEDIQQALTLYGMQPLDPKKARDFLILSILDIRRPTKLYDLNGWLEQLHFEPLL